MDDWHEFRQRWQHREITMEAVIDQLLDLFHDREMWGRVEQANIEVVRRSQAALIVGVEAAERRYDALYQRLAEAVKQHETLVTQHKSLAEQHEALVRRHEAMVQRVIALESRLPPGAGAAEQGPDKT